MTTYLLADLRTGRRLVSVPVMTGPWSTKLGSPDDLSVKIDMRDPDAIALNLRVTAAKGRSILAVQEGNNIVAAGPIWADHYDRDNATLDLTAKGIRSIFNYRYILPVVAATTSLTTWLVPDPSDSSKTMANPALATTYNGVSYATMAKRLINQAMAWTGGQLPIDFSNVPDEVVAGLTKTWDGVDFATVGGGLDALMGLQNGPEIEFRPQLTADGLGITFVAEMGTSADPFVGAGGPGQANPRWNLTAPKSHASGFMLDGDGTVLASNSWATAGRTADTVLVSRAIDQTLVNQGYPLMEVADTTHSSVALQATLDAYAAQNLADGQQPIETWAFQADAYPVDENGHQDGPQVGSYRTGDFADLFVDAWTPAQPLIRNGAQVHDASGAPVMLPAKGDPYLQQGKGGRVYTHRILALSGDEKGQIVKVSLAPQGATS